MDGAIIEMPFPQATASTNPSPKGMRERLGRNAGNWRARCGGVNSRLPDALHNDTDPDKTILFERPVHRQMASMAMQGYTPREIAEATDYTVNHVSRVLRQPAARQRMIAEAKKDISVEIKEFLEAKTMPALEVLANVMEDPKQGPKERMAAAMAILDRSQGKPNQPYTVQTSATASIKDMDDASVEARLAELNARKAAAEANSLS